MNRLLQDLCKAPSRLKSWGLRKFIRNAFQVIFFDLASWRWDIRHGVDTRRRMEVSELAIQGLSGAEHASGYTSSTPELVHRLRALNLDWSAFTFVDLGCGKGKALLLAAQLPFKKIIGVELSSKLVHIGRRNLSTYRGSDLKCRDIQIVEANAVEYVLPNDPLVIYCFNPFSQILLKESLNRLGASLEKHPRPAYFFYLNPVWEGVLNDCAFMSRITREEAYQIYAAHSLPKPHSFSARHSISKQ